MNVRARAAAVGDREALAGTPAPGLKPQMASRRLQVLAFVQEYIAACNEAPTLSEIAAGIGIGKSRAKALVRELVDDGKLCRQPGARGLLLPCRIDEAAQLLRQAGWVVNPEEQPAPPPLSLSPCTKTTLPVVPVLDYLPSGISDRTVIDGEVRSGAGARADG